MQLDGIVPRSMMLSYRNHHQRFPRSLYISLTPEVYNHSVLYNRYNVTLSVVFDKSSSLPLTSLRTLSKTVHTLYIFIVILQIGYTVM